MQVEQLMTVTAACVLLMAIFITIFRLALSCFRHVVPAELCYVCIDNPSNVVLLNCGHGGICFLCSIQIGHQCPICRAPISGVVFKSQ